jgi:hypothetical protein
MQQEIQALLKTELAEQSNYVPKITVQEINLFLQKYKDAWNGQPLKEQMMLIIDMHRSYHTTMTDILYNCVPFKTFQYKSFSEAYIEG